VLHSMSEQIVVMTTDQHEAYRRLSQTMLVVCRQMW